MQIGQRLAWACRCCVTVIQMLASPCCTSAVLMYAKTDTKLVAAYYTWQVADQGPQGSGGLSGSNRVDIVYHMGKGGDWALRAQALQRLTEAAEKAKMELSTLSQTSISLPFITATQDGPKHIDTNLSRAKFEDMCSDLLDRSGPCPANRQAIVTVLPAPCLSCSNLARGLLDLGSASAHKTLPCSTLGRLCPTVACAVPVEQQPCCASRPACPHRQGLPGQSFRPHGPS